MGNSKGRTASLDLMTASIGIVRDELDDPPKAAVVLARMAKRAKVKPSDDELLELFNMLGLDINDVPRRPPTEEGVSL
jgi:hypothetical protein